MISSMSLGQLIQEANWRPNREHLIRSKIHRPKPEHFRETRTEPRKVLPLTRLQTDVASLWCAGYTTTEIRLRHGWKSSDTVRKMVWRAKKNLGVSTIGQLVLALKEYGVKIPERRPVPEKPERRKPRIVGYLCQAVRECQTTNDPVPYTLAEGEDFYKIEKFAWQYAYRYGFKLKVWHRNGVVWMQRREALTTDRKDVDNYEV